MLGNLDTSTFKPTVTPSLFNGKDTDFDALKKCFSEKCGESEIDSEENYTKLDSLAGGLVTLSLYLPNNLKWLENLSFILDTATVKKKSNNRQHQIPWLQNYLESILNDDSSNSNPESLEQALFQSAIRKLALTTPKEGLNPKAFLREICQECKSKNLGKDEITELEKWESYCLQLLSNEEKSPSLLDDDKKTIRKALILFIMRPDLSRIIKTKPSTMSPGNNVFAAASLIAGTYTGYARISRDLKRDQRHQCLAEVHIPSCQPQDHGKVHPL